MPLKTPNSVTSLASVIILSRAYTAQLGEIWYLASFWSMCVTNSFPFHKNGLMALLLVGSMVGAGEILCLQKPSINWITLVKTKISGHRKLTKGKQQLEKVYSGITDAPLVNNGESVVFLQHDHLPLPLLG